MSNAAFVDALRDCLGLRPLYAADGPREIYADERSMPMTKDSEGVLYDWHAGTAGGAMREMKRRQLALMFKGSKS